MEINSINDHIQKFQGSAPVADLKYQSMSDKERRGLCLQKEKAFKSNRSTRFSNDEDYTDKLTNNSKILDIGCGKGYLLYEISLILPNAKLYGLDISKYAIDNSKEEIKNNLNIGNATNLPWEDNYFDFVYSLNSLHCLPAKDLYKSLIEMERVGKNDKYLCVESFRNEEEKANLLYWQVTCESFHNKDSWQWWFDLTGYKGDYSFIYFE